MRSSSHTRAAGSSSGGVGGAVEVPADIDERAFNLYRKRP